MYPLYPLSEACLQANANLFHITTCVFEQRNLCFYRHVEKPTTCKILE